MDILPTRVGVNRGHFSDYCDYCLAAASLRVPLSTLNQKIKRLNIEIRKKSDAARPDRPA